MTLSLPEARATAEIVRQLAEVLSRHPGETEVRLQLLREGRASVFELGHRVRRDPALTAELKTLLGLGAVA
jgi:DNA polymerase-3 subunit alpha